MGEPSASPQTCWVRTTFQEAPGDSCSQSGWRSSAGDDRPSCGMGRGIFSLVQRREVGPFWDTAECCMLEPEPWCSGPKFTALPGEVILEEEEATWPRLLLPPSGWDHRCELGKPGARVGWAGEVCLPSCPPPWRGRWASASSLLSAAHRTRGWITVGDGGVAVGGFHLNRRLSSRELTGHDHSRARAFPDGPLSPPWSHVPLELPARGAPSASGPG